MENQNYEHQSNSFYKYTRWARAENEQQNPQNRMPVLRLDSRCSHTWRQTMETHRAALGLSSDIEGKAMTTLQILDRIAFCIGYAFIGAFGLLLTIGVACSIYQGLQRDDEKRQDD